MIVTDQEKNTARKIGKVLSGVVVSNKMKDTIVVEVTRFVQVPKYGKYVKRGKRFKVHDEGNTKSVGEAVNIIECRPISKEKHFKIMKSLSTKDGKNN